MSSVHCVVVWEYQSAGQWLPHTPAVARTLERAHAKKLTRVVLADADPALRGHYVNLRTLTQCLDTPEGGSVECGVRRSCYSVQSPAGRGVCWEWARFVAPPMGGELLYEPLPMEVQCALEEAWALGREAVRFDGWSVCVARMTARGAAGVRLLRRAPQPPYALTRSAEPRPPPPPERAPRLAHRPRIPQQHTGSSVHSAQSVQSMQSAHSAQSAQSVQSGRGGARSVSPRDRKPGLARQIINIFSNNNHKQSAEEEAEEADEQSAADTDASGTSRRRHSVDTVSTYLSHESKESLQAAAVGELLNCSAGSDDVFEPPAPALPDASTDLVYWRGADALRPFVAHVGQPQWGALCPRCLRELEGAACVALVPCRHMLHLACLNRHLERLRENREPLYVECLVCGQVYGRAPRAPRSGPQPAGSMAWSLQPAALPQTDARASILVTYNFQSGRQGAGHPAPGAPYYAVGFPRYSLLPDTPLGRQVLAALRVAWERRLLFAVCASQTTGREHVVAWAVPPPPAERAHYAPPAAPARLLLAALARLRDLLL